MSSSANPAPDPPDRTRNNWLPRLNPLAYVGHAVVMWTFVVQRREQGWLHADSHSRFREILLHSCHRYQLMCPGYVLMPDHAHLILMGLSEGSDQRKATTFLRTHFKPTPFGWQKQAHDHVLRDDEQAQGTFQKLAQYILDNPARKSLTSAGQDWEYAGCLISGYPRITPAAADYWQKFWELYWKVDKRKTCVAGDVRRPASRKKFTARAADLAASGSAGRWSRNLALYLSGRASLPHVEGDVRTPTSRKKSSAQRSSLSGLRPSQGVVS